jgi:hypothetical protein
MNKGAQIHLTMFVIKHKLASKLVCNQKRRGPTNTQRTYCLLEPPSVQVPLIFFSLSPTMFSHTPRSSLRHNRCLHNINRCNYIRTHLQKKCPASTSFLSISHLLSFACLPQRSSIPTWPSPDSGASYPLVTNAAEEISN